MIVAHKVVDSSVCLQAPEPLLLDKELSVWLRNNLGDLYNKNAENNNKMERNLLQ